MVKSGTKKEFERLIKRYASLEKVADALRRHTGFEKVNRATIHRWRRSPSRRTELAIKILSSQRIPSKLKIAEPRSLLVLPSMMLEWSPTEGKPYGKLKGAFDIEVEKVPVGTGGEALALLEAEEVQLALAAPSLLSKYGNCRSVCSLTRSPVIGVANKKVESIVDLKGLRCGCFDKSAIPQLLINLNQTLNLGLTDVQRFPPESIADCITAFDGNQIDCFVAWQPYISQITVARPDLIPVRESVFGYLDIHVVVNIKSAHPKAIRAYLMCLQEAVDYVEARKSLESFYNDIAGQLAGKGMTLSKQDIKNVLDNSVFSTGECDMGTLLTLWNRDDTVNGVM
jgi:hypothetical protein